MLVVYKKDSGKIIKYLDNSQNPLTFYIHYTEDFKNNLGWFEDNEFTMSKYEGCYIKNGNVEKHTNQEINEIRLYKKILTEEERLGMLLQPSIKDVEKAESTLEILLTLQEVGLI